MNELTKLIEEFNKTSQIEKEIKERKNEIRDEIIQHLEKKDEGTVNLEHAGFKINCQYKLKRKLNHEKRCYTSKRTRIFSKKKKF